MLDASDRVLYVGKAKDLKKRVSSYFVGQKEIKTQKLVAQIAKIEFTVATSEVHALILEFEIITALKPKYNVIFRDDKSYPYLRLTRSHAFPRLVLHRGKLDKKDEYFGPYPNTRAVRDMLEVIERAFQLRQCDDYFFRTRTRPCLQYQIKRCSAPCVKNITPTAYQNDVEQAKLFLQGKENQVIDSLVSRMQAAAGKQDYELAAKLRDQINVLKTMQKRKVIVDKASFASFDAIGVALEKSAYCIYVINIRQGKLNRGQAFFPKITEFTLEHDNIIRAFLFQYYANSEHNLDIPEEIVLQADDLTEDLVLLNQALTKIIAVKTEIKLKLSIAKYGNKLKIAKMARNNAYEALKLKLATKGQFNTRFAALETALNLPPNSLNQIECFDVSHLQGTATVAAVVSVSSYGFDKKYYRRFNIEHANGDDYAAMAEAITRYVSQKQQLSEPLPEVILIDGGKGQLQVAEDVLAKFNINVIVLSIAKGENRKSGTETIYIHHNQVLELDNNVLAFQLLQCIRDEAHRFAITSHRNKRAKKFTSSFLEEIMGIGAKRRKNLLCHFGGMVGLKEATVAEIAMVSGMSLVLAQRVYEALHQHES